MSFRKPAPHGAQVGELLQTAVRLFNASLLKCLPLSMMAVLFASMPNIYWSATGHPVTLYGPFDATFRLLSLVGIALGLWLFSAMMLRQRAVALRAPVLLLEELRAALVRAPVLLLSALLADAAMLLGALLLLLPGIFLMVCWMVLVPVVMFEQAGPTAALLRCVQLVRPVWWHACTALVIAMVLSLLAAIIFAAALAVAAEAFSGNGAIMKAIVNAGVVGFYAVFAVFLSALQLVIHSAASSSA
jgi:hypothetical protein